MSDSEYLSHKDWLCNNPTEYEIRFNDESDVISSDSSDNGQNSDRKLIKYNQLLPKGKSIQKLLHKLKPKCNKNWRIVDCNPNITSSPEYENRFSHERNYSKIHTSNGRYSNNNNEENNDAESRAVIANKFLKPTRSKGNKSGKTVESKVDLGLPVTDTDSKKEILSKRMAKGHKRKHESSVSSEEEYRSRKKTKTNENKSSSNKTKYKESSHNVSEESESDSARVQNKRLDGFNKPNRNEMNSHLLSSESASEADSSYELTSEHLSSKAIAFENGELSDSDHGSREDEINHIDRTGKVTSDTPECKKLHRVPKFTNELNEEISKFSTLLDKNLSEKNDIWILQCPSNMDCSALVSQRLSLDGGCQLNDGEKTYEAYSYRNSNTKPALLAVPNERNHLNLCRIPICGNIIVEESVKDVNNVVPAETILEPPSRVEFPENLRIRHPLLGVDFSKQSRTAERVAEGLIKKKKHSKKHHQGSFNGLTMSDMETSSIPTSLKKKKKKNKDRSNEDIPSSYV